MNFIKNKVNKQSGSAMLLAIFVMGAMLIVALGTSSLAVNQIRQSREIKKSIIAFYVAEGGVEDGLFQVRKNNKKVEDLQTYQPSSSPYETNATTTLNFYDIEEIVFDHLKVNEIVSLDLYDINDLSSANIRCLQLKWDGKPASWLDLSWRSMSINQPYFIVSENLSENLQKKLLPYDVTSGTVTKSINLESATNYLLHSVQIKALYDEVKNLRLETYPNNNCTGVKINIPSHIYITSKGKYPQNISDINSALQVITVSLPEKIPAAPLVDYVVFSEMDIKKQIIYTGSQRAQLIYQECGPFIVYPDCFYTFINPPLTNRIIVENIGILDGTISVILLDNNPTGAYSITTGENQCQVGSVLTYGQTCNIWISVTPRQGATADLSVSYTPAEPGFSPIKILLKQQSSR